MFLSVCRWFLSLFFSNLIFLLSPLETSPSSENKDFTIGRITQQNTDLKTLVQKLKIKIDELVLRKDKSCFMCREELRSVKSACNSDLELAKNEYSEKLEDLGDLQEGWFC